MKRARPPRPTACGPPPTTTASSAAFPTYCGKFDGIYGVLAGLEVLRALNDAGVRTQAPIDVIVWTNEEGVRFGPSLSGSSAFAGMASVEAVHPSVTLDGTTVRQDLEAIGYLGNEPPGSRKLDCFVEAHIEQGPILEAEGLQIGVVTQIQGIRWSRITVTGMDSHAGTTPMDRRRDALVGAAEMIVALNRLARGHDRWARLTVGRIEVHPNSGATIPGKVTFNCDLRHPEAATLDLLEESIRRLARDIAAREGLEVSMERVLEKPPVHFAGSLVDAVRDAARRCGYTHMDMLSGAGHDAMNVARVAPTAMIFVLCKDGLSHNEAENATPAQLAAGADVLLHTLLARAADFPDFNDPSKLGEGKEMVEKLSDLVGISPANTKAATTAYDPNCGSDWLRRPLPPLGTLPDTDLPRSLLD